ncbi:MAG: helix-hairpin-helix domain-containing protein [Clostridia bacterium]|nr:helix-hairpin-helix domain-containing protein [Clostridia bacterium]
MKENENKVTALAFFCAALAVLCLVPIRSVKIDVKGDKHTAVYGAVENRDDGNTVDINVADAEAIATTCGIEAELAERIVRYRLEYGPFASVDELTLVSGIGSKTLEKLRLLVTAGEVYR